MRIKLLAAAAAAGGLALCASQAQATIFKLDSIDVAAHTQNTNGLIVNIDNLITSQHVFDLADTDPQSFALFRIYTTEGTVNNGEDTVGKPIDVSFDFSAPLPNTVDPVTGETNGYVDGPRIFGHLLFATDQKGTLSWDNGGVFNMHFGNGLTGLMTISLNGGVFNDGGILGTDQGCTPFHGCNPESRGLTVYGTFDWANDPTGGVPEPAAWALMLTGFGCAGATLRRRRALATA